MAAWDGPGGSRPRRGTAMTETASGSARSGKSAGKGLTVQRIHTRDGRHPAA